MDDLVVQSRVQLTETPEERIANMMAKLTIWAELSSQRRAIELQKGRDLVTDPTPVGNFFFNWSDWFLLWSIKILNYLLWTEKLYLPHWPGRKPNDPPIKFGSSSLVMSVPFRSAVPRRFRKFRTYTTFCFNFRRTHTWVRGPLIQIYRLYSSFSRYKGYRWETGW